jgi:hypothetical protein
MHPSLEQVRKLLPPAQNKAVLIADWQNANDVIKAMADAHIENLKYAKKIAHLFKGSTDIETCKNVFNFLRYEVPYKVESASKQQVKTLPRFLQDSASTSNKQAIGNDCKMYAVFTNTVLNTLGINSCYRFVSYKGNNPTHTYSVVKPLNLVIDAVLPTFDTEKPYFKKKDMSLYKMSGVEEEDASRKYLDLSSVDSTIGRLNLKKVVSKSKQAVTRAVKAIPQTAKKVVQGAKTVGLAVPRNAFLGLVALNVRGFATSIKKLIDSGNDLKFWVQFGGDRTELKKVVEAGAKKKRIAGFEEDINAGEKLAVCGIIEPGMIGVEPVSTASALASATPIIVALQKVLKSAGIKGEDLAKVTEAVKQGTTKFKELTGKNLTEVIFKKEPGVKSKKISLKPADLKIPSIAEATKVAKELVKKATGITEKDIKETSIEETEPTSNIQPTAQPTTSDAGGGVIVKPDTDKSFFEKNKFTILGVGVGVLALFLFTRSKKRK